MESRIEKILEEMSRALPHFPDGRIDYSRSPKALVLTCFPMSEGRVLLLRRSCKVGTYRGLWNAVAGYVDEPKPIEDKIREELSEELGLTADMIEKIKIGQPYEFFDEKINKTWIVIPSLAELKEKIEPKLDWEHTGHRWIMPEEMARFPIVPMLEESFKKANL